jgi:hypothetical protein
MLYSVMLRDEVEFEYIIFDIREAPGSIEREMEQSDGETNNSINSLSFSLTLNTLNTPTERDI